MSFVKRKIKCAERHFQLSKSPQSGTLPSKDANLHVLIRVLFFIFHSATVDTQCQKAQILLIVIMNYKKMKKQ